MVSYTVQAILAIIFGPVLSIALVVFERQCENPNHQGLKFRFLSVKTADIFYQCNVFVSLSVLIASVVRLQQGCSLTELLFVRDLSILQVYLYFAGILCRLSVYKSRTRRSSLLLLYCPAMFALSVTALCTRGYPDFYKDVLLSLTDACNTDQGFPTLHGPWLPSAIDLLSDMGTVILFSFLLQAMLPFGGSGQRVQSMDLVQSRGGLKKSLRSVKIKLKVYVSKVLPCLVMTLVALTAILVLVGLRQKRQILIAALDGTDAESEWGFGQILAILVWAPLLHDVLFEAYGISP